MRTKENLTKLGSGHTEYRTEYDPSLLEAFDNLHPENDYFVKANCPEFTSLCPITGQPDYANIVISYVPDKKIVESKSLKLYLFSYRNHGDYHEDVVNTIMKDISLDPYCNYGTPGTRWEEAAWERLARHDMNPEMVNNR